MKNPATEDGVLKPKNCLPASGRSYSRVKRNATSLRDLSRLVVTHPLLLPDQFDLGVGVEGRPLARSQQLFALQHTEQGIPPQTA